LQQQKERLTQKLNAIGAITSSRQQIQEIRKLFAQKEVKSALTRAANKIILGNAPQRKEMEGLQEKQAATVERIRTLMAARIRAMTDTAIAGRLSEQNNANEILRQKNKAAQRYTAVEIRKTIYDTLTAIRAEKRTISKTLEPLEAKFISEARAKNMAIDIYTQHKTKDLREFNRTIKEKSEHLQKQKDTLLQKKYAFLHAVKPNWFDRLFDSNINQKHKEDKKEIEVLQAAVGKEETAFNTLQDTAAKTEIEINTMLKLPEADAKIWQITLGILKKTQHITDHVFSLRAQKSKLEKQEKEFTILAEAATRQIKADSGRNISYTPAASAKGEEKSNISVVSMIAKAFSGNDAACAAVVRMQDDDSLQLDWEGTNPAERQAWQRESSWSR
jgi:hypothetical protein